jgi:hypothetical protein
VEVDSEAANRRGERETIDGGEKHRLAW